MVARTRVVAAVIEREGRLLICRRPAHKRHGGLWEFPGGKVENGEDDLSAVRRELSEELGVEVVSVSAPVFERDDPGSEFTIVFVPTVIEGEPQALEHEAIAWCSVEKMRGMELAPSDAGFVGFLVGVEPHSS